MRVDRKRSGELLLQGKSWERKDDSAVGKAARRLLKSWQREKSKPFRAVVVWYRSGPVGRSVGLLEGVELETVLGRHWVGSISSSFLLAP